MAAAIGLAFVAVNSAYAQVSTVNSVILTTNALDGLPDSDLAVVDNYPSVISFIVTNAGTTNTAFSAMQDFWQFSVKGQTNAYMFQSNDFFTATMSVTLTGSPVSPRKEAGFAFNDSAGNINGQYILDTDAGEVVAFGGNLPFYASPLDHTFQSGDTITMGVTLLQDNSGNNAIIYSANGIDSPVLEFGAGSPPEPYTLGGYFQLQGQGTGTTNFGSAVFQNISIGTSLSIAVQGTNQVVLYYPASGTNFVLQTSTNLNSTNWTTVVGEPITGVILPAPVANSFYRLQAQ
jgi:hypothetical protein